MSVNGDFNAGSGTNFDIDGSLDIDGDMGLESGTWNIGSTGSITTDGTGLNIGNVNITNDGTMSFPNVAGAGFTKSGGGNFDCDGSGDGIVVFGGDVDCSFACNNSSGSKDGGCYSNGD